MDEIRIYKNNGDDSFDLSISQNYPHMGGRLFVFDIDNDKDLDIVFNSNGGNFNNLLINNGNLNFTSGSITGIDQITTFMDFDNDGDKDVYSRSYNTSFFYDNIDDLQYQPIDNPWPLIPLQLGNRVIEIDLNKDNLLELVEITRSMEIKIHSNSGVQVLHNTGWREVVSIKDLTNDGFVDFLIRVDDKPDLTLLVNNQDGTFTSFENTNLGKFTYSYSGLPTEYQATIVPSSYSMGDVDNDGDVDILTIGKTYSFPGGTYLGPIAICYLNNGDYTYSVLDNTDIHSSRSHFGDYDNDGDLDILTFGQMVYRNDLNIPNSAPTSPTNPTMAYSNEDSGVIISWDIAHDAETPDEALTYNVFLGTSPNTVEVLSPEANIATGKLLKPQIGNAAYSTAKIITKIKPGIYYWGVQAIDNGYAASTFATGVFEIPFGPINAPSSLQATAVSSTQIDIRWTDNSFNEEEFVIERSSTSGSDFVQIASAGIGENSYSDEGLIEGATYYYRLKAINAQEQSLYSEEVSNATLLSTPSNLLAIGTPVSVNLSWNNNSTTASSFIIERSLTSGTGFVQIDEIDIALTSYNDNSVANNTVYYYRLKSSNASVASAYSMEVVSETIPNFSPSLLVADAISSSNISIAWSDNSNNENNFILERSVDNNTSFVEIASVAEGTTSYNDLTVADNYTYFYRVKARNLGGDSGYSNEVSMITFPDAPTGLTVVTNSLTGTESTLNWIDNSALEDAFIIERKLDTETVFSEITTLAPNTATYIDIMLPAGQSAYYRVKASNSSGASNYSNEAYFDNIPLTPSNLQFTYNSPSQIVLSWAYGATIQDSFDVFQSVNNNTNYVNIGSVAGNLRTITINITGAWTQRYYKVRARNAQGVSGFSPELLVPLVPATPGNFVATRTAVNELSFSWDDVANESHYTIEISEDGGIYQGFQNVNANVTTLSKYYYPSADIIQLRIKAVNSYGVSAYVTAPSITIALETPGNFAVARLDLNTFSFSWLDNSLYEDQFKIEISEDGGSYTYFDNRSANSTSFSRLYNGTASVIQFRIRAINNYGASSYVETPSISMIPEAPGNFTVTQANPSYFDFSWLDNSQYEDEFQIEISEDGGNYDYFYNRPANSTSFSRSYNGSANLIQFRIKAVNTFGFSVVEAPSISMIPEAPTNFIVTRLSSGYFSFNWDDNSQNVNQFEIEISEDGGSYAYFNNQSGNSTSFSRSYNGNAEVIQFRIKAVNNYGGSAAVNEPSFTMVPIAPGNFTVTRTSQNYFDFSWLDNSLFENQFRIEISEDGGSYGYFYNRSANSTSFSRSYYGSASVIQFKLRAVNNYGSSEVTSQSFSMAPVAPDNFIVTLINSGYFGFTWNDNSQYENQFEIEISEDGGSYTYFDNINANNTSTNKWYNGNAEIVQFRIKAINNYGSSAYAVAPAISTTPIHPLAPAAPSDLMVTREDIDQFSFTWVDNSQNENYFEIEISEDGGSYDFFDNVNANWTSTYNDYNGNAEVIQFRIKAINNYGSSLPATAPSIALSPLPPDNLTAQRLNPYRIRLFWVNNNALYEEGFKIERSIDGGNYDYIGNESSNSDRFTDYSAPYTGTPVTYRVSSYNDYGDSDWVYVSLDTQQAGSRMSNPNSEDPNAETPTESEATEESLFPVDNKVIVYPNPTSGEFSLKVQFDQVQSSVIIMVFSVAGEIIYENTLNDIISLEQQISLTDEARGLYMVKIYTENESISQKIIYK